MRCSLICLVTLPASATRLTRPTLPVPSQAAVQQRALRVLKQKKLYEGQIGQLQQQTFNMEQASLTTDNLRNTMATVDAMKTANKELKKQYGKIDIDKIEQMQYEMEDLIEQANEVQESMSRTYNTPEDLDEADLEAGKSATQRITSESIEQRSMLTTSTVTVQSLTRSGTSSARKRRGFRVTCARLHPSCQTS